MTKADTRPCPSKRLPSYIKLADEPVFDPVTFMDTGHPGMFNRYAYALNDPINNIDPTGECVPGLCPTDIAMSAAAIKQDAGSFGVGVGRGIGASLASTATLGQMTSASGMIQVLSGNSASNLYAAAIGPAENVSMAIGDMQGENFGSAAQAVGGPASAAKAGTSAVAKTGQSVIQGFTKQGVNQAINRGVKPDAILDAVKNPLKVGATEVDDAGRQSQRFTGGQAPIVVNPQSGKVVSVNPTSTRTAERLRRQNE